VSTLLARVTSWLLEPADGSLAETPDPAGGCAACSRVAADAAESLDAASDPALARVAPRAHPPEVAVLAAPSDVHALAAAFALRLTRGVAVVGLWTAAGAAARTRGALPPTPAARRLAARLTDRDLPARAVGRLVTTVLPADEAPAAAAATRLLGAVTDAPVVLAAGGPRGAAWDGVLARCDVVAVHAIHDALADLALTRLAEQGVRATRIGAPAGAAARLARAGLALPGGLDGLAEAVRAVGG